MLSEVALAQETAGCYMATHFQVTGGIDVARGIVRELLPKAAVITAVGIIASLALAALLAFVVTAFSLPEPSPMLRWVIFGGIPGALMMGLWYGWLNPRRKKD